MIAMTVEQKVFLHVARQRPAYEHQGRPDSQAPGMDGGNQPVVGPDSAINVFYGAGFPWGWAFSMARSIRALTSDGNSLFAR